MSLGLYRRRAGQISATFLERATLLMVLCDLEGRGRIQTLVEAATEREIPVLFSFIGESETIGVEEDALDRAGVFLSNQPMGTRVAVAARTGLLARVESILEAVGLTSEEVWVESQGVHAYPVFCAACYHGNPVTTKRYIRCEQCQRVLEVSNHYSPRLHAVMGYVSLPEQREGERDVDETTYDAKL